MTAAASRFSIQTTMTWEIAARGALVVRAGDATAGDATAGDRPASEPAEEARVGSAVGLAGAAAPGDPVAAGDVAAWQEASRRTSPRAAVARVAPRVCARVPSSRVRAIASRYRLGPGSGDGAGRPVRRLSATAPIDARPGRLAVRQAASPIREHAVARLNVWMAPNVG